MKILVFKKFKNILLILFALLIFTSCSSDNNADDNTDNNNRLNIYTSFYPVYDFTSKIGGDKISVKNIVPTGTEPHDWEPTPKDMQSIAEADMLIYNGLGMEQWVEKVTSAVGNDNLKLVEASNGVELITVGDNSQTDYYDTDPHIWTSIRNAVIEMENIKNALCEADSENSDYYEENFNKYKSEFEALDKEFEDFVSNCSKKDIIVAHDAFSYLCRDYGLNQIAINGLSAESEPEPSKMAEIVDFAKNNNIKIIFYEELISPKAAQTIANEIGAETTALNPLEGLSESEEANGDDYLSVMKKNLEAIKKALV